MIEDPEGVDGDEVAQPLGEKSRNETFTIQKGISGRGGSGRYKTNRPDSYQHYSVCVFCLPLEAVENSRNVVRFCCFPRCPGVPGTVARPAC